MFPSLVKTLKNTPVKLVLPVKLPSGIIRFANSNDIESIYAIYTPYILNSAVSFETELPSIEDFTKRIETLLHTFPFLVFEDHDGKVKGYAYVGKYRERKAYQWCVESSIYMADDFIGKGVAKELYQTLINLVKEAGHTRVYGVIAVPNDRSEAFHRKLGFEKFATFKKTGFKLGKWWDVAWYELVLNDSEDAWKTLELNN
jgi:L-amino acid N-acyltransferase YncA